MKMRPIATLLFASAISAISLAAEPSLPLVLREDFESGTERWQAFDPTGWSLKRGEKSFVFSQFKKTSNYRPPHRSPLNIAMLNAHAVSDFELRIRVLSTHADYDHRDACIVFGYQDPAHFYYVHFGKKTDDHANQIFIVNDAPRVKISQQTTPGTPWDERWHDIKLVRNVATGSILVYFDDMNQPVMTAKDNRFSWGRVGIGSFDDTSDWDDLELRGVLALDRAISSKP